MLLPMGSASRAAGVRPCVAEDSARSTVGAGNPGVPSAERSREGRRSMTDCAGREMGRKGCCWELLLERVRVKSVLDREGGGRG